MYTHTHTQGTELQTVATVSQSHKKRREGLEKKKRRVREEGGSADG